MTELEHRQTQFAKGFDLTLEQYKRLASALDSTELISCLELLKAKRCKSVFRNSCQQQLRQWLEFGGGIKPLSVFQLRAITPKWPIKYRLPT